MLKKRFITTCAALFFIASSTQAWAHTHLETTSPANKEVVTQTLQSVTVTFDGQIEKGSTLTVTTAAGETMTPTELSTEKNTLQATFATPFANDEYTANWVAISQDGHPIDGEFTFTVNVAANGSATATAPLEATQTAQDTTPSAILWGIIVLLFVILMSASFFIWKRKK